MKKRRLGKKRIIAGVILGMVMMSQSIFAENIQLIDVSSDITLRVTSNEMTDITNKGMLGDIIIEEKTGGELAAGKTDEERTIVLSLEDTDYVFSELPEVTINEGFEDASKVEVEFLTKRNVEENKIVSIKLPYNDDQKAKGKMTISNLNVATNSDTEDKTLELMIGRLYDEEYTDIKVANILTYGAAIDLDKAYTLKAGDSRNVSIILKEGMSDSLIAERKIEYAIDKGFFKLDQDEKLAYDSIYVNGKDVTSRCEVNVDANNKEKVTSFSISVPDLKDDVRDIIEIKGLRLFADLSDRGDVTLSVTSRNAIEKVEKVIATIDNTNNITIKKIDAAYNVRKQVGGAITIQEKENKALEVGVIKLAFEGAPYIEYTHLPKVEVTEGNIRIETVGWDDNDNVLTLKVTKKSTQPSVIVISDFTFNVSGKCPDGKFGLTVSGDSIAPEVENAEVIFDDFMTVSDRSTVNNVNTNVNPNTSNNNNTPSIALVTKFKLGSNVYEVNGISNTMDATVFSQNGRTMVPIRYVAKAVGIDEQAIKYNKGTITISAGKTVIVKIGSRNMVSGTETITMATEPAAINGRTYVPVAEIARALGIKVEWNSATQTATFKK